MRKDRIAVVENGQVIEFVNGEMRLGDRIPGGYIFVDGSGVGDVDQSIVQEREMLGQDGIVVVNLAVSNENGALLGTPEILSRGFILSEELDQIKDDLQSSLRQVVSKSNGNLENEIIRNLKSTLYQETKRNPYIFVTINRI
jgi:ribonuclease J